MTSLKKSNSNIFFRNLCIVMIWFITLYSLIIQYVVFQLPYAMLMMGGVLLISFVFSNNEKPFVFSESITEENKRLLWFMAYVFIAGLLFAPNRNVHISQWTTCLEYLFIQIVIASIIKSTGTDIFQSMLLVESIILAIIFVMNPVEYMGTGRYSISFEVNPNGLGLGFVAGIWSVLYRQQKMKQSLVFSGIVVALFGYCILLTGSRKSLIGAGIVVFLWMGFCYFPSLKEKGAWKGLMSFLVMMLLVLMIAWGLMNIYENSEIAVRMNKLFSEVADGNRSNMYRDGYELIKKNPLFGIGFQGFKHYFGSYSHATLVEIPVSGGIIGAFLYFGAYFISLKNILLTYKRTKNEQDLYSEHVRIKMLFILWIVMMFCTVCVIHPYQFDSSIYFGIIFGETAYLENRSHSTKDMLTEKKIRSKYIRYE